MKGVLHFLTSRKCSILRFVPYPHEMRNTMTVHLLDYMNTPKPNQCTLRRSQSTVFKKLLSTSVLNHRTKRSSSEKLVMERCSDQTMKGKKRFYYRKPKVYDVWETSAEIPRWWRVTSQNWVVFLIGRAAQEICFNQSETQIWVMTFLRRHFTEKAVMGDAKCRLFSYASFIHHCQN